MSRQAKVWIGTSGYQYDHWEGPFYPEALPRRERFAHYARHFDTVEINNTFYRLPDPATFDDWRQAAPEAFCYALKFSRYGSHLKCLKEPRETIRQFLDRAERLGRGLGPILVQLKPHWSRNLARLKRFLEAIPAGQRWAFEFRDESWLHPQTLELLRTHQAALCVHDMIPDHPRAVTSDWIYLRFHGEHYAGSYTHQFLTAEARRIAEDVAQGREVYAYFNNDADGHAVQNASDLRRYLNQALPSGVPH